jgi:hypothetical protein
MSLPYYYEEYRAKIEAAAKEPGSDRTALLAMDEKEFKSLYYGMPQMVRFMKDFGATVKAVEIERRNNYPNMIKNARKLFSDIDIDILEYLSDELAYYTSGIVEHVGRGDLARTKKSLKLLKRRGLIEIVSGLFDEDGMTAGSGWMKVDHKLGEIEQILEVYRGPEQESLL